jgi:hypothetical protein
MDARRTDACGIPERNREVDAMRMKRSVHGRSWMVQPVKSLPGVQPEGSRMKYTRVNSIAEVFACERSTDGFEDAVIMDRTWFRSDRPGSTNDGPVRKWCVQGNEMDRRIDLMMDGLRGRIRNGIEETGTNECPGGKEAKSRDDGMNGCNQTILHGRTVMQGEDQQIRRTGRMETKQSRRTEAGFDPLDQGGGRTVQVW